MIDELAGFDDEPPRRSPGIMSAAFNAAVAHKSPKSLSPLLTHGHKENQPLPTKAYTRQIAVTPPPLPDQMKLVSGFYLDDDQVGWELARYLPHDGFETPSHITFAAAFPTPNDKQKFDILTFEIRVTKNAEGQLVPNVTFEHPITSVKSHDDTDLKTALREIAAFANPSFGNRNLPRIDHTDPAFQSLFRAVDISLGQTYKLSDVLNFTQIDDVLFHSLLASHLPDEFKDTATNIDIDAASTGPHHIRFSEKAALRDKAFYTAYPFKMQSLVREVTFTPPASPPPLPSFPSVEAYNPGLLKYVFNRHAWQEERLFNAFTRELSATHLRLVSMQNIDPNSPMSGDMEIAHKDGTRFIFKASFLNQNNLLRSKKPVEFQLESALPSDALAMRVKVSAKDRPFAKSSLWDPEAIDDFARQLVVKTLEVFHARMRLEKLDVPAILESARMTAQTDTAFPKGMVLHGPLTGKKTWEDIDQDLRKLPASVIERPHGLSSLLDMAGLLHRQRTWLQPPVLIAPSWPPEN